jgi:diguanylate cyclase (GGDEF)-like protein
VEIGRAGALCQFKAALSGITVTRNREPGWQASLWIDTPLRLDRPKMPKEQDASNAIAPSYDALTKALTRPSFLVSLREHAQRAQDRGHTFCICLIDVDHLQNINDQRGLRAGDQALQALAERLRETLAQPGWHGVEHTLARYDGDTLVVLSHPCDLKQGEGLAEALRFHVAEAPLYADVGITVSIGVAQFRIGETIDDLLARTERSLHMAKQFGRDRVEASKSPKSHSERASVRKVRD